MVVIRALYPRLTPAEASDILFPHHAGQAGLRRRHRAASDGVLPAAAQVPSPQQPR